MGVLPRENLYQYYILVYVIDYNWVDTYRCSHEFWPFQSQSETWGFKWYTENIPEGISAFMTLIFAHAVGTEMQADYFCRWNHICIYGCLEILLSWALCL